MKAMNSLRARGRFIALALLPALMLRVLTPVGFMPMRDAHGALVLAFCPGMGDTRLPPASTDDPHRGHHGMRAQGGHGVGPGATSSGDERAPAHHDVCPYALSAGPALAYAVPDVPVTAPRLDAPPMSDYPSVHLPNIERAQSARAPPAPRIA